MKRSVKNIILILIIIAVSVGSYFTMKGTSQSNDSMMAEAQNGNMGEPPSKPEGDDSSSQSMGEPPSKPEGDNSSSQSMGEPPSKPEGDNSSNQNMGEAPSDMNENETKLSTSQYVLFAIEGLIFSVSVLYLILSKFNKLTFKETITGVNKIIVFVILAIICTVLLTFIQCGVTKKYFASNAMQAPGGMQMMQGGDMNNTSSASVTKTGATTIEETGKELNRRV